MTRKHPAQELEEDVLVRTSNMGQGRSDYEAFHTLSPAIHLREIHTHDFFELYIHLNGFPRLYVDNKIVTLQRGSLMIFPPFVMHGIISQDTIRNYERVVLFISSGMLHQLGQGLLPLEQRLLDCTRRTGYHYQLDEAALSLCTTCIDRVAQNTGDERPESRLADYAAMTEVRLQEKRRIPMKRFFLLLLAAIIGLLPLMSACAEAPLDGYPGIDELPAIDTINNPFEFFDVKNDPNGDGVVTDITEWEARRTEIRDLIQHYWLGYRWETAAEDVSGKYEIVYEDNTASYGGFYGIWGACVFNLGDEFRKLSAALLEGQVTVGDKTFGPASTKAEAKQLAIEAWNAGYSVHYIGEPPWGTEGDAVFVNTTGAITEETIPARVRPVYQAVITITNPETGAKASFAAKLNVPTDAQILAAWGEEKDQVPFVIDIGGTSAFSAANLNGQGYGLVTFKATDIYPDDSNADDGIDRAGVYTALYPYDANDYKHASGALMAWSWAASQIVTALENQAEGTSLTLGELVRLDPAKTVITGHSRYGKAAMFTSAFDDRISICVPSECGGSGIQSYRYKVEGKIFNFNTSAYAKADRVYGKTEVPTVSYGKGNSWFPETAAMFVARDNQIPFDPVEIIALVAPRPFFTVSGIDTHWLGNEGAVASMVAAEEVYDFVGTTEIEKNNIAVRARQSDHVFYPRDFCFALAIMDREFKQTDDKLLHVKDLFPEGTGISGMSYPAADYATISELNDYPFDINSSYIPWSAESKYTLWTAQETFLTNHNVTITAHSDAPDVVLVLPDGREVAAASHEGDVFTFTLTAEQSVYGRYELRTVGTDKAAHSVYFSAVSLADALRHGTTKGDEGEENRVLGFASRLANTKENPPLVYIGSETEPASMIFTPERVVPEDTSLLEYGILFHDALFIRIANAGWDASQTFKVKNLKFVSMPEYTFEFSMADIAASAENNGKQDAALFTKPISWNAERYNNGFSQVWPAIPDTLEERQALERGETITRPEAPEKTVTAFDATVSGEAALSDTALTITLTFSEALRTGEYAVGMDIAEAWETAWNADGTQMTLTVPADALNGQHTVNLIIFRLMDTDGNLIGGPVELHLDF